MKQGLKHSFAILISALWLFNANAQNKDFPPLQPLPKAPANVTIDGHLTEWNDSLFVYNKDSKLKYALRSDDNYLYLAADLDQKSMRQKVLGAGITLSINTEGKKKKTYSFTYPLQVSDEVVGYIEQQKARLTNAKTSGFKGVNDNMILPDAHGFKAVFAFTAEGSMGYEVAIPLNTLNIKPGVNTLNINIKVNAMDKPTNGTATPSSSGDVVATVVAVPSGSRAGGRGSSGSRNATSKSTQPQDDTSTDLYTATDFWLSYTFTGK